MNKALDTRYSFFGMHGYPSLCHLRVYVPVPREAKQVLIVLVTQHPDNPGTSITNFAEELAAEVWKLLECPTEMVWIENYEASSTGTFRQPGDWLLDERFLRIEFETTPHVGGGTPLFSCPCWLEVSRQEVETLIGQPIFPIVARPAH